MSSTAIWRDNDDGDGSMLNTGSQIISVYYQKHRGWVAQLGLTFADVNLPAANDIDTAKKHAVLVMRAKLLTLLAGLPDEPEAS